MTIYNAGIRLVAVGILAVMLKQQDNGKSKGILAVMLKQQDNGKSKLQTQSSAKEPKG